MGQSAGATLRLVRKREQITSGFARTGRLHFWEWHASGSSSEISKAISLQLPISIRSLAQGTVLVLPPGDSPGFLFGFIRDKAPVPPRLLGFAFPLKSSFSSNR